MLNDAGPVADDQGPSASADATRQARARLRAHLFALPPGEPEDAVEIGAAVDVMARLDDAGFLAGPGESAPAVRARGLKLCDRLDRLDDECSGPAGAGPLGPALAFRDVDRIDPALIVRAGDATDRLYGFRLEWAPGFYWTVGAWKLWGGCAWGDPEEGLALFLLRREFRDRECFFIYGRGEILAHELCHVARWPFAAGDRLEEFHAYQTSGQPLRRYLGNCFSSTADALLFAAPSMLLAVAQAARVAGGGEWPMELFWGLALAGPLWLLLKNHAARQRYFAAHENLRRLGVAWPEAVLFRAEWTELPALASLPDRNALACLAETDWRWRATARRFFDIPQPPAT